MKYRLKDLPPHTKRAFLEYMKEHPKDYELSLHSVENPRAVWLWRIIKYKIPMTPEMATEWFAFTFGCDSGY